MRPVAAVAEPHRCLCSKRGSFICRCATLSAGLPYFPHMGATTLSQNRLDWFLWLAFLGLNLKRATSVGMERV